MKKKVLVAGYFDLLHSGHICFLEEVSKFGDVYISLGSDSNSLETKNKKPIYTENERKYTLKSIKYVKDVEISNDEIGPMSFLPYLEKIKPDYFITNEDGSELAKKELICKNKNIEFIVLKRVPKENLKKRSSTSISAIDKIPHRLDLVGFYDQKHLNSVYPGSVILVNINTLDLNDRSGMSSSTRNVIRRVFGNQFPKHLSPKEIAEIIFAVENPPGHKYISGVVDQLGLCLPGINRLKFDNNYWPYKIDSIIDEKICNWLQNILYLKQTQPRPLGYNVFDGREKFDKKLVKHQSELGDEVWGAIKNMDSQKLGNLITQVHNNQKAMIPGYEAEEISDEIVKYNNMYLGAKLMGAGGYGYVLVVADGIDDNLIKLSIRNDQNKIF